MRLTLVALVVLLWPGVVRAQCPGGICNVSGCQQANIQAAINQAVDGDVVNVGSGTCTITVPLSITDKSIEMRGQGIGVTTLVDQTPQGAHGIIRWQLKTTGNTPPGYSRITGFTFNGGSGMYTEGLGEGMLVLWGRTPNLRIDHNRFVSVFRFTHMYLSPSGDVRGLIDHNTFDITGNDLVVMSISHPSWNGQGDYGDFSFNSADTIGTRDQIVLENNTCNGTGNYNELVDDYGGGGRWTARFNTLNNCFLSGHGTDSGGWRRATRHIEVYYNTGAGVSGFSTLVGTRGGTGLVHNNTMTGFDYLVIPHTQREQYWRAQYWPFSMAGIAPGVGFGGGNGGDATISGNGSYATATFRGIPWDGNPAVPVWGPQAQGSFTYYAIYNSDIPGYDGTHYGEWIDHLRFQWATSVSGSASAIGRSPFDGNTDGYGYPVLDQPGRGVTVIQWDQTTTLPPPPGWPQQALEPWYTWSNLSDGAPSYVTNVWGYGSIQSQRDYYHPTGSTSVTGGVGTGPLASRPACVTANEAYWATDTGEWNSTNGATPDGQFSICNGVSWVTKYGSKTDGLPLAYPHCLISLSCSGTNPPGVPIGFSPFNGAVGVLRDVIFQWTAGTGATAHEVRFGTTTPPPQVVSGQSETTWNPAGLLEYATLYYWQVVEHNAGGSAEGPIISFTTETEVVEPPTVVGLRFRWGRNLAP